MISATECTPVVSFDAGTGKLSLRGKSYDEDTVKFYQPLFNWLDEYTKSPQPKNDIDIELVYFNSASQKCLYMLISKLADLKKQGKDVTINWYFKKEDDEMKETGEEFSDLLSVPFIFKEID